VFPIPSPRAVVPLFLLALAAIPRPAAGAELVEKFGYPL
jgi:hypothetical protein